MIASRASSRRPRADNLADRLLSDEASLTQLWLVRVRNFRIVDAYNPGTRTALESKSGRQSMRRDPNNPGKPHPDDKLKQQIDRDRGLLDASDVPIEEVTWHFFASDVSGYIADDPLLFDYLRANNIPYEIHLP